MDVRMGAMASLVPKLEELLNDKHKLQGSSREDVEFLRNETVMLEAALVDEVRRRVSPRDQLALHDKIWAREARQLSYDMELAVDSCLLSETSSEVSKGGFIKKMRNLFKKGKTCHELVANRKAMMRQVQELVDRLKSYDIDEELETPAAVTRIGRRLRADQYTEVTELVGIDGQKDQDLMKLLSDGDDRSDKKLKIVSVVGFGGLGKTTLVRAVYNKIKSSFDCRAFISAGQNAAVYNVLMHIILDLHMCLDRSQLKTLDKQRLIEKLGELLENKRYLIVIDDIWNEEVWEIIKLAFSGLNSLGGSIIITTTRIVSISEACCSSSNDSIYQMEPLSDDDSKKLLYDRIFSPGCGCPEEYKQVSIDILKKCGGVPLAIITMASMLASYPVDEWHVLLSSTGHASVQDGSWEEMRRIVSLSYHDLSPRLKTCLLCLSIFPGSLPIIRERLVKKLVAEGIVTQETMLIGSPEEAASHCLDELVNRNLIHPLECNNNGEVISYHIHPMIHCLLKDIAIDETFADSVDLEDNSGEYFNCLRGVRSAFPFLSINCPDSENQIDLQSMALDGVVHSLTVFGHANIILPTQFKYTRVLDLEGCKSLLKADVYICSMVLLKQLCLAKTEINELPPEIGNLHYLQGLDVGGTQITKLPPEIGNLQLLERLNIRGTEITELPTQIGKLQRLKTLDARKSRVKDLPVQLTRLVHLLVGDEESCEGVKLPDGIGKMTSLQKLCTIDLRKCSASSLKKLGELPYLEEIAVVSSDEQEDTRINDSLLSSLDKSTKLRSLVVYSNFRLCTLQSSSPYKYLICRKKLTVVRRSLKVPAVIAGHHLLGMLDIRVCKLEEDDLKILRELPGLQSLIVRVEVLPTKMIHISCEGFGQLESFCVDCRMPRVIFEEGAMPKLEHLELKLYAGSASDEHLGIKHLLKLQKVTIRYSKWYATNKGVRDTTDAVKIEAKEHQNEITLCVAEEDKGGKCIPKTEIFQENRVASCSRLTEIEEEKDTQEGSLDQSSLGGKCIPKTEIFQENRVASCSRLTEFEEEKEDTQEGSLDQSSCANASCSGTGEIEEVVE